MAFSGFTSLCVCVGLWLGLAWMPLEACPGTVGHAGPIGPVQGQPSVGLNMIVKNEAHVIERALRSIKPYIHYYLIVDTGSTDDTMEIIKRVMEGVPGQVVSRPWIDFATNRNEALDLIRPHVSHAFFLDADDVVEWDTPSDDLAFTKYWPALHLEKHHRGAMVHVKYGTLRYRRMAIVATASAYRWAGAVHEVIHDPTGKEPTNATSSIDRLYIRVVGGGARSKDPLKYQRDALLLLTQLQQTPNDPRATFYLAQSYRDAGETAKAIEWYEKRVEMGGWREEVFWSLYQLALMRYTDDAFARAARFAPWRMEPIYYRAKLARERGDYSLAFALSSYCDDWLSELEELPSDTLFLDTQLFNYGCIFERSIAAYWVNQRRTFENDTAFLLKYLPQLPEDWRAHVVRNKQFMSSAPPAAVVAEAAEEETCRAST